MPRRRRTIAITAGVALLIVILATPLALRGYESPRVSPGDAPLTLLLTALNTRDAEKAVSATEYLLDGNPQFAGTLKRASQKTYREGRRPSIPRERTHGC